MDLKDAVAANIRRVRYARKMTQEELAGRAALSPRYVSRIETGSASPTVSVLGRLAKALEVDPCELIRLRRR